MREAYGIVTPIANENPTLARMRKLSQGGYTYIVSNKIRTVLYVGVSSDLYTRISEHKDHKYPDAFSARYNCEYLMWYAQYPTIEQAIAEEKRIKGGSRKSKIALIEAMNPGWTDLYESF